MFAQLEDDAKQVEKITVTSNRMEIPFKKRKERSIDYESQVRQGVNVIFKELIYKLIARIRDKPYFKKPETNGRRSQEAQLALEVFLPRKLCSLSS